MGISFEFDYYNPLLGSSYELLIRGCSGCIGVFGKL
jgi:hypothetical protein